MKITTIVTGLLEENCYLVESERAAVVIDPGEYVPALDRLAQSCGEKETLILLTHCHFDHMLGAGRLRERLGCPVVIGDIDAPGLGDRSINLCSSLRLKKSGIEADRTVADGEIITCADLSFRVIATPGHTAGSVCYLIGEALFSGDTLFAGSVGRTDFKSGDTEALRNSLRVLGQMDPKITVYPGHYEPTSIGRELAENSIMREACGR